MQTDQIDKQELKDWIDDIHNQKTLLLLQSIKNSYSGEDWWDEINEAEKASIKQGEEDFKTGRYKPSGKVWEKYEHRL